MSVIEHIRKSMIINSKNVNRALFLCNIGLGDQIDMIGAVRYLSQFHNQIYVPCFNQNIKTLSEFYSDNSKVVLIAIDEEWYTRNWLYTSSLKGEKQYELINYNPSDYTVVYRTGWFKQQHSDMWPDYNIPKCFYKDLDLDLSIEHSYFHIPENLESKKVYETVKDIDYIFVHQRSSDYFTSLVTWDIDQIFTIDPNVNLYSEGHHWYDLARNFVKRPFPHYTDTIINASEVHLVNSSFRCLAAHLPLKASIKKCYARKTGKHIPEWTFNRYHPTSPSQ
jgi:hypothetical protein